MDNKVRTNEFADIDCYYAQELDRKRIASELHDTSIQDLTHIIHQIELSSLYIDVDPVKAKLELADINVQIRKIIQDIRNTIFDLRPMSFDDLGLRDAIHQYIEFLKKNYTIEVETRFDEIQNYDKQKKLVVYRIIQECLANAAKHSNGDKVVVTIKGKGDDILLSIEDNGIGIQENYSEMDKNKDENVHYGLSIVKDRVAYLNGSYNMESDTSGTKITIVIPHCKNK